MPPTRRVGAYAKLLANYAADDAIIAAGEAAELLFVRGLAFNADSDSDGYITEGQLVRVVGAGMRDAKKRAATLVEHGLWEEAEGGYVVRSWLKIHDAAEEKGRKRRTDRERKRHGRASDSERIPNGQDADSERNPDGVTLDSLSLIHNRAVQDIATRTDTAPRARDELFDTLAEVCKINPAELTKASRGSLNGAVGQLRAVNATPNQVKVRANRYRQRYPDSTLTPPALAKHWPTLDISEPDKVANPGW